MTYILITNDDGVHAPGILALTQAMRAFGEVQVIAPASNQSSSGHKKTLFTDIPYRGVTLSDGTPALAVSGSPADCIAVAALGLVAWPPSLVVSGINRGANLGQDVTYSGTVTAAFEAAIQGIPAVAFSLDDHDADTPEAYAEAARIARHVVAHVLMQQMPPHTILSVNIPKGTVQGLRLTRQGLRTYHDVLLHKEGAVQIVGDPPGGAVDGLGTDLWAIHQGYASITPLHLDMTAHAFLAELNAWQIT